MELLLGAAGAAPNSGPPPLVAELALPKIELPLAEAVVAAPNSGADELRGSDALPVLAAASDRAPRRDPLDSTLPPPNKLGAAPVLPNKDVVGALMPMEAVVLPNALGGAKVKPVDAASAVVDDAAPNNPLLEAGGELPVSPELPVDCAASPDVAAAPNNEPPETAGTLLDSPKPPEVTAEVLPNSDDEDEPAALALPNSGCADDSLLAAASLPRPVEPTALAALPNSGCADEAVLGLASLPRPKPTAAALPKRPCDDDSPPAAAPKPTEAVLPNSD
mmetsp:Transcript_17845/g.32334  ORF Transcript_17845/g.32334 Transcript_17845/m.32334 type:complete len:277 (+) Transcript_17845:4223-5053(+)